MSRHSNTLEDRGEFGDGVHISGRGHQTFIANQSEHQFRPESYNQSVMSEFESKEEAGEEEAYHVFTQRQKWKVVLMIGLAGLFSGLSSNIYFPSLDVISKDLNVSFKTVSLTITSYLVVQGISPMFWGSLSDTVGRRPIYIYSFLVYIAANIALSFSPNFAVLVVFRGLQAAGSASTVSIGNGVIQDITPPAERGGFMSFYQAIRNFSIAVGPVAGGILAHVFGFRSIFIFLLILSSVTVLAIITFFPETLRSIAGNGSFRLTGIHQPLISKITKEAPYMTDRDEGLGTPKVTLRTFYEPLLLFKEKDILLSLVFGGTIYAIWSMVTSSTTTLFKDAFHLNELLLGLAFLPNGLGTIVGSTIVGILMNKSYAKAEKEYKERHNLPADYRFPKKDLPSDFPIEHTRLRHTKWIIVIFMLATIGYGFSLAVPSLVARPGWIAIPLMFQFFIAASSNAIFSINQTLLADLCPGKGASSTAINNLVRCLMGSIGVAFIEEMIDDIGVSSTFLGLGLVTAVVAPLLIAQWYLGPAWRKHRMEKRMVDHGEGV